MRPTGPAAGPRLGVGATIMAAALLAGACTGAGETGPSASPGSPSPPSPGAPSGAVEPALISEDDLVSGGPPPDGIPPIDDPKFLAPDEVTFLEDQEPLIAVDVSGVQKAYPLRIMMWHEIVNDEFDGVPVVVTYCPLCNTGIAYLRPTIDGELLDFGTSGKLYLSNLVMYDRQTFSYWPQATGQAVIGPLLGKQLEFVPARILSWGDWSAAHPDGLVLSIDTGHDRNYGANPYAGYDSADRPFLFAGDPDPRLPSQEHILGVSAGDERLAFPYSALRAASRQGAAAVGARLGGTPHVIFWKAGTLSALDEATIADSEDVGAAAAYLTRIDGRRLTFSIRDGDFVDEQTGTTWSIEGLGLSGPMAGEQLTFAVAIDSFWFDWAAFHPDTGIFGAV